MKKTFVYRTTGTISSSIEQRRMQLDAVRRGSLGKIATTDLTQQRSDFQ